jgi:hypothetical protein
MVGAITIDTGGDWFQALWISAVTGALASLVAELLLSRGKAGDTGAIELPHTVEGGYVDLGSIAAIPVGVLAAVIGAFALTPVQEVVNDGVVTRTVELDKLIVVAAVAGLASSSFLKLLQERFIAVAKNQRLDAALKSALQSFDQIAEQEPTSGTVAASAANVQAASTEAQATEVAGQIAAQAMQSVAQQATQAKAAAIAAAGTALHG